MGNKARNYGLPTQESLNEVLFGSPNFIQNKYLDRRAVNIAISRVIMPYPDKVEDYSNFQAARDVARELRNAGFQNIHVIRSIVFDKNDKFKVVRPPYNRNVFVAVGEKQKKK